MPGLEVDYLIRQPDQVLVSVQEHLAHLAGTDALLQEAAMLVYEATGHWFDSKGEGSWSRLSEATVAKKAAQGAAEPSRPLYQEGNLRASVTSPTGPYSYYIPMFDGVVFGVAWTPAKALAEGTDRSGLGHQTKIPARPIFPPADSTIGLALMSEIGHLILYGSRSGPLVSPAYPGALVGRGAGGRFVSLRGA